MASKRKRSLKRAPSKNGSGKRALTLEQIEELLGEEFETLAQAQRELQRSAKKELPKRLHKLVDDSKLRPETKPKGRRKHLPKNLPAVKPSPVVQRIEQPERKQKPIPTPKRDAKKKSYTIHELKTGQRKSVINFLNDEANAKQLTDNLLKPGEYIGLEIPNRYTGLDLKVHKGYARSYALYSDFGKAFKRLSNYVTFGKFGRGGTNIPRDAFIESIKVIKFGDALPKAASEQDRTQSAEIASKRWFGLKREEQAERKERKDKLKGRLKAAEKRVKELERELKKQRKDKQK